MKKMLIVPAVALMALTGCTNLSAEDRALINNANMNAQEARTIATQALDEARAARAAADKAAADARAARTAAEAASEKADRIFRTGQGK